MVYVMTQCHCAPSQKYTLKAKNLFFFLIGVKVLKLRPNTVFYQGELDMLNMLVFV